jgi:hypothetical protein
MTSYVNTTGNIISITTRLLGLVASLRGRKEGYLSYHDAHSTCSGDSEMGVIGLEVRRCFLPLLRLRSVLGFFCA